MERMATNFHLTTPQHHRSEKFCYPNKAKEAGDVEITILCFLADVGFTVGKLFPAGYNCHSLACANITHNCVMTLSSFIFSALECAFLHQMAGNLKADQGRGRACGAKLVELVLCLTYVVYDSAPLLHAWSNSATVEPLGVGTIVLVAFACLTEALLIAFEGYTIWLVWTGGIVRERGTGAGSDELAEIDTAVPQGRAVDELQSEDDKLQSAAGGGRAEMAGKEKDKDKAVPEGRAGDELQSEAVKVVDLQDLSDFGVHAPAHGAAGSPV